MRRYIVHIIIALLSAFAGTAQAQIVDTVCALGGPSNLAVAGTTGSTYQWNVIGGTILNGQGTSDITVDWPSVEGLYSAYVIETTSFGCIGDTVVAQIFVAEPNSSYITGPTQACRGQLVEIKAIDSKRSGKFLWNSGDSTDVIQFIAYRDTTIFRVALNENCENDTVFHQVKVLDVPTVSVDTDAESDTVSFNTYVNFNYVGNTAGSVDWYLNDLWMGSGSTIDILYAETGWNELRVIAVSGMCSDTLTHNMWVEDEYKLYAPSAFSPNGDGLNDVWTFDGLGFDEYEVTIFNRWGDEMAHWDHRNPSSWDGTYRGSYVSPGSYSYRIRAYTMQNHLKEIGGTIMVIR